MTTVIKSDKNIVLQGLMSINTGISLDFRKADFKINNAATPLSELLTVLTSASRGYYGLAGSYNVAEARTVKIGVSPETKKRGLHTEPTTPANLLGAVALSLPKQHSITLDISSQVYFLLSMQGSGEIKVKDTTGVEYTVTQYQPAYIKITSTPSMTLTLLSDGDVEYVSLINSPKYNTPPVNRNTSTTTIIAGDRVRVSDNKILENSNIFVCSYSALNATNIINSQSVNLWCFKLVFAGHTLNVGVSQVTGDIIAMLTDTSTNVKQYLSLGEKLGSHEVVAVKTDGETVSIYRNGTIAGTLNVATSPITGVVFSEVYSGVGSVNDELNAYVHEVYITPDNISNSTLENITKV